MKSHVLVTFASKHGATAEIAEKIGTILLHEGLTVDLLPVKQVGTIMPYTAVVLGSAVYIGRWQKDAAKFLQKHEEELAERDVWLFSSGPTGEGDPVELLQGWEFPEALHPVADRIQPHEIAVFHGAVDLDKLNIMEKILAKNVDSPIGDFRDWGKISA